MGNNNSRIKQTEKILESEGIRFVNPNNKSLRLYFQSQFQNEIEDEDLNFLYHVFELKVFLYFHEYYDRDHLLDTDKFLFETFEKNIETIYSDIKDLEIIESEDIDNLEDKIFIEQFFNFQRKKLGEKNFNICIVNSEIKTMKEFSRSLNINSTFLIDAELSKELEIYILLNDNTNIVYFVLYKIFKTYGLNLKKININQIGLKTVDELMYTVLAYYLRINEKIDSVCINAKVSKTNRLNHLPYNEDFDQDERLENPIINRQHFFNFYSALAKKTNLIELRILLFIRDYNFVLLSNVISINQNLRILEVRNVARESENRAKELDYSFYESYSLGENIRDEIFIFFNYLNQLEYLEQLYITHFWFNSEINFLACEASKNMKNLKVLSLERNQAIVNNDLTALNNFNLEETNLEKLNLGLSYFNMVRRFDYIINAERLKDVNIGVLDFISFSSFIKFIEKTNLERVCLTLNKPCSIQAIPFMFEQISDHPFRALNLRYFYVLNAYTNTTYEHKMMNIYLSKLIQNMKNNNTIRKLSFKRPCILYTSVKETEIERQMGKRTFRFINKKNYNLCAVVILILRKPFNYVNFHQRFDNMKIQKDIFVTAIFKNIIYYAFSSYRKIVLE